MKKKVRLSDEEWKKKLPPETYRVCRQKGTEPAFAGKYWDCKEAGVYHCAACGQPLFRSEDKYDSGTGWPSFVRPTDGDCVSTRDDGGWFESRTEVLCNRCDSHLGHAFDDGPAPTGKRFCVNSASLELVKKG